MGIKDIVVIKKLVIYGKIDTFVPLDDAKRTSKYE